MLKWKTHRGLVDHCGILVPFNPSRRLKRALIVSANETIAHAMVFPFFDSRSSTSVREIPLNSFTKGRTPYPHDVDYVLFQTWFDLTDEAMVALVDSLRQAWPTAKLIYLDWFAPTDLRYARALDTAVDLYVKKQVLADRSAYDRPTLGDTNLTDYYARAHGLDMPVTHFPVSEGFWDRFRLGPGFEASPQIVALSATAPEFGERPIDLHARIAVKGSPWYQAMRQAALDAVRGLGSDVHAVHEGRVSPRQFFKELRNSKLCFSPFGYGEICWRDYEAMATGAVLLKPDVGHLSLAADLFRPGETYVPLRWDLADLEEKVRWLLGAPDERRRIAQAAYTALRAENSAERMSHRVADILSAP